MGSCEIVAMSIESINIINIVIYRPPDTCYNDFVNVMKKIEKLLSDMGTPEPSVIITGDFNFRFIEWSRNKEGACSWKKKSYSHGTRDEQNQFNKMMETINKYHLVQTVEEKTRKDNTLDLVFTNNLDLITQIDITGTIMSDHDIIEIETNIVTNSIKTTKNENETDDQVDLRQLNFHHEKIDWEGINKILKEMPWNELFHGLNNENCTELLLYCIKEICLIKIPKKKKRNKNNIPKERKRLLNRIKMLKRKKRRKQVERNKEKVIDNMKDNPKIFFNYIKEQKNKGTQIGPFKIDKEYIYDAKKICKSLIEQYNSQFSETTKPIKITEEELKVNEGDISDIEISEEDISKAIGKLKKNSAAGPDGVPAIFLINTKEYIKLPLKIMLRKSIDDGKIPDVFKLAYVTPLFKGVSKMNPANYRPVSLTSHIMKVFERVITMHLIKRLQDNNLI